ncbi:MAG: hypothetical protein ABFS34_09990 [Gemmatimonadota bacterium]
MNPRLATGLLGGALLALGACGGGSGFARDPAEPTPVPRLAGMSVMLFPVQGAPGQDAQAARDVDAEIEFWAADAVTGLRWSLPSDLQVVVDREPALQLRTRGLAIAALLNDDREFVRDPLLGDLRRLGAVADRNLALVPVRVLPPGPGGPGLRLDLALVNTVGGAVLWRGRIVGEEVGESAAASLARVFVRSFLE